MWSLSTRTMANDVATLKNNDNEVAATRTSTNEVTTQKNNDK